ncbi:MAG: hypothetical protein ACRC2J_17015, partial [Microcoleaceae cyanobacterium]
NTDNIPRSDITPDSDLSNISEGDSNSDLTKNSDELAITPESNQANDQIALVDEVSENNVTNKLTNNSELPEINETTIEDDSQDQLNQEKPNTIDDLVADNSITDNAIEDNQTELVIDDIAQPDTNIVNETIKDSENIASSEPNESAHESANNLTDSLPLEEKSDNNSINNENISAPVKTTIPTELITTEPDLPVEKTQVQTEPIKFTPEQYLVISIKNQIADITNRYGGGMVDSIQVNFLSGLLVIQVTDDWYDLDKTAQNQLANNLFKQAQDLDFTKLQIADNTGKLVARSPVVGEQMIILARSQSGVS